MKNEKEKENGCTVEFAEPRIYSSQLSIATLLKEHEYYFEPINKYSNTLFYCVLHCRRAESLPEQWLKKIFGRFGWDGFRNGFTDYRLLLSFRGCDGNMVDEPMVFTRSDVNCIVKDAPEHYIGEDKL